MVENHITREWFLKRGDATESIPHAVGALVAGLVPRPGAAAPA